MDRAITILYLVFIAIEVLYLVSCFVVIARIIKFRKSNSGYRLITAASLIFLSFCILGSVIHNIHVKVIEELGTVLFVLFLIIEISYLFTITHVAIKNVRIKTVFSLLLLTCILMIPYFALKEWNGISYDPLFAYESLIAASISFAYFLQLGEEQKIINLLQDPVTLIMLGLFFCYSLPFAYNTTMAAISIIDPTFYPNIRKSKYDQVLLSCVSRVGTICYIILNIFIYKAFKCRVQVSPGF